MYILKEEVRDRALACHTKIKRKAAAKKFGNKGTLAKG